MTDKKGNRLGYFIYPGYGRIYLERGKPLSPNELKSLDRLAREEAG